MRLSSSGMKILSLVWATLLISATSFATTSHTSDLPVLGIKHPNSPEEGRTPIQTRAWAPSLRTGMTGFSELVPFALSAPDQEDAGTCLYMSLTGIVEWWLAHANPTTARTADGPLDLSERWLINLSIDSSSAMQAGIFNWKTDSIYLVNNAGHAVLNRDYRFTKGWYTHDQQGYVIKSSQDTPGSLYGTSYNWIDDLQQAQGTKVATPRFRRDVLFADPASNQWNVGVMPAGIIDQVKTALLKNKAPVHVLYNHFGYWHALMILGYDDDRDTHGCEFVEGSRRYFKGEPKTDQVPTPEEITELADQRARFKVTSEKLEKSVAKFGSCNPRGMFYVRDSIYTDPTQPYIFDASSPDGKGAYSKRIVMLEYNWLQHLANHAVLILPENP